MKREGQTDEFPLGPDLPIGLIPDLVQQQMAVQLPFQATELQMARYSSRREWLFGMNPLRKGARKKFVSQVKENILRHPDDVTALYVTGESVGTGKENECAQWVAEVLFDTNFRSDLINTTGKDIMPHYLTFGMAIREARAAGLVESEHPNYNPIEISHGRDHLQAITQRARRALPLLFSGRSHLLIIEVPVTFAIPGRLIAPQAQNPPPDSLDINPNTFMKMRMSVPGAQDEALFVREHYNSPGEEGADKVRQAQSGVNLIVDNEDFHPGLVAWNCGDSAAARRSRDTMDRLMADASRQGLLPEAGAFTERDLQFNPDLRFGAALRDYYSYLATEQWRIFDSIINKRRRKNWMIDDAEYISGEKHFFQKLLYAHMLDTDQLKNFHIGLFG